MWVSCDDSRHKRKASCQGASEPRKVDRTGRPKPQPGHVIPAAGSRRMYLPSQSYNFIPLATHTHTSSHCSFRSLIPAKFNMSMVDRNDSKKAEKKSVYFNFGPDDSYFLRIGSQHRRYIKNLCAAPRQLRLTLLSSLGRIGPEQPESWTSGKWQSFDCVAWTEHSVSPAAMAPIASTVLVRSNPVPAREMSHIHMKGSKTHRRR